MKKLLIAMTAAAVGFGAWAEGNAGSDPEPTTPTITYLNESFGSEWTLAGNAWWSYSAELGDGELVAGDALTLNTGSKVLTGKFASNGSAVSMAERPYFNATVTFKDPSDTLPELASGDKFALVVLDNVECVDAKTIAESKRATNLWVIAGHETGTRAYLLCPVKDGSENLNDAWLKKSHEIIVKAYSSVMADKQNDNAGFLVMVDGNVCPVLASYAITNKMIDYANYEGNTYLGYTADEIDNSLVKRYTSDKTLLISASYSTDLTSVDFQGQGEIDEVELADSTEADFGDDATVVTFSGYSSAAIESITYGGKTVIDGEYTIDGTESVTEEGSVKSVEIVVTLKSGYAIKVGNDAIEDTYEFTTTLASTSEIISLDVFEIQARVNGTAYGSFAEALAAADGSDIVLARNVTIADAVNGTYGLEINSGNVVIDLNGKTIQAGANEEELTYSSTFTVYGGSLLIKDSSEAKTGKVLISAAAKADGKYAIDATGGLTTIKAGQIGLIGNYRAETLKLVGGTYTDIDEETFTYWGANEKDVDDKTYVATLDPDTDIWTVAEKLIVNYNVTVTATGATVSGVTDGEYADGKELTFTVAADEANGYENAVVTVNGKTVAPVDGQYTVTVDGGDVAIVVTASLKTFAATYSVVDADGNTVENGATVSGLESSYQWGTKLTFTVASVGDYIVKSVKINGNEANGSYEVSEVKANVNIVITVEKKAPAGPTVPAEQGSVSEPDVNGNVTVSPNPGVTEITISGTVTGSVTIPSSVEKVTGVAFEQLVITYTSGNKTSVITDAFKAGTDGTIVLNEGGIVNGVPVKPAMAEETPLVVGSKTTDVAVKTIPGLTYKLMRGTDLKSINDQRDSKTGTGEPVTLTDPEETERPTKAFYRIHVSR